MNVTPKRQRIQTSDSNVPIILVVEDEPDNLLFISHTLIFLKYNFITVTTGQDALNSAIKYDIDLVLLDLVLPDINGLDVVSLLKENQSTKKMPIIAISALVQKNERESALKAGCDDYLEKPYLIDDLKHKISQYLPQPFFYNAFFNSPLSLAFKA